MTEKQIDHPAEVKQLTEQLMNMVKGKHLNVVLASVTTLMAELIKIRIAQCPSEGHEEGIKEMEQILNFIRTIGKAQTKTEDADCCHIKESCE